MKKSSPEYGSVVVVNEVNEATVVDLNESWVQAYVIGSEDYDTSDTKTEEEVTLQPQNSQLQSQATPAYRDLPFAILFIVHLGVISFLAQSCGSFPENMFDSIDGTSLAQAEQLLKVLGSIIVPSIIVSFFATYFVTAVVALRYPMASVVRLSLYFSVITYASLICVLCLSYPSMWTLLLAIFTLGYSVWYVSAIQPFIPFAAATLKLGLAGITTNWGMYIVTMFLSALWYLWIATWIYVANGIGFFSDVSAIMRQNEVTTSEQNGETYYSYYRTDVTKESATIFLMLVSLYWISTILTNITQTTVAGVIGTWAFGEVNTSTSSCSNTPVIQSLHRSCTTSFGSICFGSLLNAVITATRVMLSWAEDQMYNENREAAALLFCVLKCIVLLFEDILEYFNQWAYIFVGLYGTTYLQSGKSVIELFNARGCSAIISDGLSSYFMNAVVMSVGLGCGTLAFVGTSLIGSSLNPWVVFWTCFVAAIITSGNIMYAVQGAVKAVMVCYFDHPGKMFQNHPEETKALADVIALVFPSAIEFDFPTASSTTV